VNRDIISADIIDYYQLNIPGIFEIYTLIYIVL